MIQGIKTNGSEYVCGACGQKVSKDGKLVVNFCPKCGNPLNIDASVKYEKDVEKEKLVMLYTLLDSIEEGNDAKTEIESMISELKED